jgi:hypothetical protein
MRAAPMSAPRGSGARARLSRSGDASSWAALLASHSIRQQRPGRSRNNNTQEVSTDQRHKAQAQSVARVVEVVRDARGARAGRAPRVYL